jgi:Plasmid pRiA4b ORF-3-like protein
MPFRDDMRVPDVSPEKLALEARSCSAFASAQTLAEWVGPGRKVTAQGVLKSADAVEACDALGIEAPSRKPRSALDIHELMAVWATAFTAEFIEVSDGRVTAGPALEMWLTGTPDAVVAIWRKYTLEFLGLDEMAEEDLEYLTALAVLHDRGGEASLDELTEGVAQSTDAAPADCPCPDCVSDSEVDIRDTVRVLGMFGIAALRRDSAELTPLGHWLTDSMFRSSAPPADADCAVLIRELADLPDLVAVLMARPWLASRSAAEAVRELLAVAEPASGKERLTALMLARECGPEAAPVWQEWAAKDGFGAYARVLLAQQDDTEPADADLAWITADALATMVDGLPPEVPGNLLLTQLQAQAGDDLTEVLAMLENSSHPAAPGLVKLLSSGPSSLAGKRPALRLVPADGGDHYEIKVQLSGVTKPPVWRRLQIPAAISLGEFHEVIQVAMGWENHHMHVFSDGRNDYGLPDIELGFVDEWTVTVSQMLTKVGDKARYTYDFGDTWDHDITLEKIHPAGTLETSLACTAGNGACPPEDCGGVWGYENLKETLADPNAERHSDLLDWLGLTSGDDFNPKEFSVEEINRRFGPST